MTLDLVSDYIGQARILMLDIDEDRYSDAEYIAALNIALLNFRRVRPDLFIFRSVPSYSTTGETVDMDEQYRDALLAFMIGYSYLRDQEETEENSAKYLTLAKSILVNG